MGKSTLAAKLLSLLEQSVWLDGDDVWRMNPFLVTEKTKAMVENNIVSVLNEFIKARFSYILFTWVLHEDAISEKILEKLDQTAYETLQYTLVCSEQALTQRLEKDRDRDRNVSLALDRLRSSRKVTSRQIDTSRMHPDELAQLLLDEIRSRH